MRRTFNGLSGRRYYYPGLFAPWWINGVMGGCLSIIFYLFVLAFTLVLFWVVHFF